MEREEVIINSVKKLIALELSDREIIDNLKDVGIEEEIAKDIIAKARGKPLKKEQKKEVKSDSGTVLRKVAEELAEASESTKPTSKEKPVTSNLSRLWEKGIITTVNQRLNEMKQLKREIDAAIEERTREVAEREVKKIQALLESKTTLLSERVNSKLEAKESEVIQTITLKIGEMKAISKKLDSKIDALQKETEERAKALTELREELKEIRSLKEEFKNGLNKEEDRVHQKVKGFIEKAETKINELDERVSKTLELEQEVIDGILDDAKRSIKEIGNEIKQELKEDIQKELKKVDELKNQFSPEKIKERIQEVKEHRKEIKQDVLQDLEKVLSEKQKEVFKPIQEKFMELDLLEQKISKENKKSEELKKIQSQILEKMRSDIASTKQEVQKFILDGEKKLREMDKQVTDTMALQSQLTETLTATPGKETLRELKNQMNEIKHYREEVIQLKQEIEGLLKKSTVDGVRIQGLAELETKLVARYDEIMKHQFKNRQLEFNEQVGRAMKELQEVRKSVVEEIKKEVNLPKIKSQMEELDIFKEQFINVIDRNVEKFNQKIKKFNESTKIMDELFQQRLKAIDRKIEELDRFEKAFAREMGIMLDKLANQK